MKPFDPDHVALERYTLPAMAYEVNRCDLLRKGYAAALREHYLPMMEVLQQCADALHRCGAYVEQDEVGELFRQHQALGDAKAALSRLRELGIEPKTQK